MPIVITAPKSPSPTEPDRSVNQLTEILGGPLGDELARWAGRIGADPTSAAAYPDSPESILRDVDNRELTGYLQAAARVSGELLGSGPAEAAVRWARIEEALLDELRTRIEALTDIGGPF